MQEHQEEESRDFWWPDPAGSVINRSQGDSSLGLQFLPWRGWASHSSSVWFHCVRCWMKQITPYPDLAPGERELLGAAAIEVLPCSKNSVFLKFLSQRSTVHVSLQPERFLTDSALTHNSNVSVEHVMISASVLAHQWIFMAWRNCQAPAGSCTRSEVSLAEPFRGA